MIYKPDRKDWMGFPITKRNKLTYHHIEEARKGGPESVDNGALLTIKAHAELHQVEHRDKKLYEEYQNLFRTINDSKQHPTQEMKAKMAELKKKAETVLYGEKTVANKKKM